MIVNQMKAENCSVVGGKCVKNDKGELAFTNGKKHLTSKGHYERLLIEEFPWDKENLVLEDSVI